MVSQLMAAALNAFENAHPLKRLRAYNTQHYELRCLDEDDLDDGDLDEDGLELPMGHIAKICGAHQPGPGAPQSRVRGHVPNHRRESRLAQIGALRLAISDVFGLHLRAAKPCPLEKMMAFSGYIRARPPSATS